ncbi:MAG: GNAT family N-acetyltransferase, partial [Rhizobiaceae bacterium]
MSLDILPLTDERWPLLEDLFGPRGAHGGCWCMYFRQSGAEWKSRTNAGNKSRFRDRVSAEPPPGLLAIDDGKPVGWMQIGPRPDVPKWSSQRRASAPLLPEHADAADVWAISCFYVRVGHRRAGLMHKLVEAGIDFAKRNGARVVEACPIDKSRNVGVGDLYVGSTQVFEKASFE